MTLSEFERLPANKKLELLHKEGIYIGKQKTGSSIAILYQLDSFYVEIFYRKYRSEIDRLNCFTSPSFIDPYLNEG
jgi:hypothetical protein